MNDVAPPSPPDTTRRHLVLLVILAIASLALDLVTKGMANTKLVLGRPIDVLGDIFRLTLVHNTGTAFGLFQGMRWPFVLFSCVAVVAILVLFFRLRERTWTQVAALGLLLGGALGNLHDRALVGAVTDFIEVGIAGHYWPVFNIADAAITIGVALLAVGLLRPARQPASPPVVG